MALSQQNLEIKVFETFVKHTKLNVICFQPCKPPEPDILCVHQSGKLYFELTDNTSEAIQKSIHAKNVAIKRKAHFISPFPEQYRQKFNKHYETCSLNCELIIYFGAQPVAALGQHFDWRLKDNVKWIRQSINRSEFHKVWIYDYQQDRILARVERA